MPAQVMQLSQGEAIRPALGSIQQSGLSLPNRDPGPDPREKEAYGVPFPRPAAGSYERSGKIFMPLWFNDKVAQALTPTAIYGMDSRGRSLT